MMRNCKSHSCCNVLLVYGVGSFFVLVLSLFLTCAEPRQVQVLGNRSRLLAYEQSHATNTTTTLSSSDLAVGPNVPERDTALGGGSRFRNLNTRRRPTRHWHYGHPHLLPHTQVSPKQAPARRSKAGHSKRVSVSSHPQVVTRRRHRHELADRGRRASSKSRGSAIHTLHNRGGSSLEETVVRTLVVDQAGAGDFSSVQAAVNSIQDGNSRRVVIQIRRGTYREKVVVPASKPYVTFQGEGRWDTSIVWHDTASDIDGNGHPLTAYNSASVIVFGSHFIAYNISFMNTAPSPAPGEDGKQAAAFRISGDMAAFVNCGFYGAQDTLCDDSGRHYFKDCYIQGSIDYIFGDGQSLYQDCELHTIASTFGSIAAQNRQDASSRTGFSFVNCVVSGTGQAVYLGRAMGPYSRIVFARSYLSGIIASRGWDDWNRESYKDRTVTFGQYRCFGPGAGVAARVPWSHELSDEQAQPYLHLSFIDAGQWLL